MQESPDFYFLALCYAASPTYLTDPPLPLVSDNSLPLVARVNLLQVLACVDESEGFIDREEDA